MKRKTPQEKKSLSYAKDCRNTYGESDKGSRKSIRRNKTVRNQVYRRKVRQVLTKLEDTELENAEIVESEAKSISKSKWKKYPDKPLGEIIREQLEEGVKPIRRRLKGTMKNVSKKQPREFIQTEKGWWTEKR